MHAASLEEGGLRATRRWGEGYCAVMAQLPVLLTVAPRAFPPRYPHGARIMSAYREWQVPVWGAVELGLSEADLAPVLSFRRESFPPPLQVGEQFEGDPASTAQDVLTALRAQKIVR